MRAYDTAVDRMAAAIAERLSGREPSIYLYGSCVEDDFRFGWSDIDILVLTRSEIDAGQAAALVGLRREMSDAEPDNPYYRLFEGGMLTLDALIGRRPDRVVYWGTSGQRIAESYDFDACCQLQLLDRGRLLCGRDVRNRLARPSRDALRARVRTHCDAIRAHAHGTERSLYAYGWMLDISRGFYTLRTGGIIAKTAAGAWALKEGLCPAPDLLRHALEIRMDPSRYANASDSAEMLFDAIQRYAGALEIELERSAPVKRSVPACGLL